MKKEVILSVIIVKYHCDDYLRQCLKSLKREFRRDERLTCEVVISDNDKENIGFGAGCNHGAVKAIGKYLLFLNPDTVILENCLTKMIDFMEKNPHVGVLGPKIYKNNQKDKQLSFCRFPDPLTSFFVFSPFKSVWPDNPIFSRYVYNENKENNDVIEVEAVAGAALMVRKEVFDKVGGFDENFFLYFEENDLCRRIKKLGYQIIYFPEAEVIHFGGKSVVDVSETIKIFKKSRFYFFKKHYGFFVALAIELPIRILENVSKIIR